MKNTPPGSTSDSIIRLHDGRRLAVQTITCSQMFLWQGELDRVMPTAAARLLVQALPQCTATFYPQDGHLSTFVNHAQEIWKALSTTSERKELL